MLWIYPAKLEQHDDATSVFLVVKIILLHKLFSGRAHLTSSHACVLQISSTMIKYLVSIEKNIRFASVQQKVARGTGPLGTKSFPIIESNKAYPAQIDLTIGNYLVVP